jgi:hypothetical protein
MFLLQALGPPGHRVFLIHGNAQPMTGSKVATLVRANRIEFVGVGAITQTGHAYQLAGAVLQMDPYGIGSAVEFRWVACIATGAPLVPRFIRASVSPLPKPEPNEDALTACLTPAKRWSPS